MADEAQKPRAFTLKDGRIAYGTVEFEDDKYMRIRGMYIVQTEHDVETGDAEVSASSVKVSLEPFSMVGSQVQVMTFPKDTVVIGELAEIPEHIIRALSTTYASEARNAQRRDALLSRNIAGGTDMSPEDVLAGVAQHMRDNDNRLPGYGSGATEFTADVPTNIIASSFKNVPTSPYHAEESALAKGN